jgi:uncharacterized alkaline shock family protein YloU
VTGSRWTTLPCGTDPVRLIAYAADGTAPPPGSHEATCPYCQAAIGEFAELWRPLSDWAHREIRLPDHFRATVMNRVRRLVQSPRHVATISARGTTTVTSWVLGLIASAATRDTPGVTAITGTPDETRRRPAIRYGADGVDIHEIDEHDITVNLGLTAALHPDLVGLAESVRRNVIAAIENHTTIRTSEVDISIDDLDLDGA